MLSNTFNTRQLLLHPFYKELYVPFSCHDKTFYTKCLRPLKRCSAARALAMSHGETSRIAPQPAGSMLVQFTSISASVTVMYTVSYLLPINIVTPQYD